MAGMFQRWLGCFHLHFVSVVLYPPTPLQDVRVPPLLTRRHERLGVRRFFRIWLGWSASTKPLVREVSQPEVIRYPALSHATAVRLFEESRNPRARTRPSLSGTCHLASGASRGVSSCHCRVDTGDPGSSRYAWSPVFVLEKLRVWQGRHSQEVLWSLRSANWHFFLVVSWVPTGVPQHPPTHFEGSVTQHSHPPLVVSRLATSVFHCPGPACP